MKFRGRVIEGQKLARELGAPTANLSMPVRPRIKDGVWLVRVSFEGGFYGGVMHIGSRPTTDNNWSVEVHILDFSGDLLGKVLEVESVSFLREIIKFDSVSSLGAQIRQDIVMARKFFIRENVRMAWGKVSESERVSMSDRALEKIGSLPELNEAEVIYLYAPDEFEIPFVQELCTRFSDKKFAFPRVENKRMKFYLSRYEDLEKGKFGILEPEKDIPAPEADLIFVPAMAGAKSGERLGRGGGFYDQFLCSIGASTICVLPDFARVDDMPMEGHDIRVDRVVFV